MTVRVVTFTPSDDLLSPAARLLRQLDERDIDHLASTSSRMAATPVVRILADFSAGAAILEAALDCGFAVRPDDDRYQLQASCDRVRLSVSLDVDGTHRTYAAARSVLALDASLRAYGPRQLVSHLGLFRRLEVYGQRPVPPRSWAALVATDSGAPHDDRAMVEMLAVESRSWLSRSPFATPVVTDPVTETLATFLDPHVPDHVGYGDPFAAAVMAAWQRPGLVDAAIVLGS